MVLIVLEGDLLTLKAMSEAVDNGTAVIVMNGSGQAADLVSYAYNKHK